VLRSLEAISAGSGREAGVCLIARRARILRAGWSEFRGSPNSAKVNRCGAEAARPNRSIVNWRIRQKIMNQQTTGSVNTDLAPDRTGLAKFRTQLALDRTTLAWIRTTLTMSTFGFGTVGFFRSLREKSPVPEVVQLHEAAIRFGFALVFLGIAATVLAGISHWATLQRLGRNGTPVLTQWPLSITFAMLLAIAGLVSVGSLLAR